MNRLSAGFLSGSKSIVDSWVSAFDQTADDAIQRTVLHPSLGAYAVSMDIYFQGERFRGYFANFTVSERATTPGLFDYNFEFVVTKRMGKRTNFMPWHRTPVDATGQPIPAAIPAGKGSIDFTYGDKGVQTIAGTDRGLSYPPTYDVGALRDEDGEYTFRFAQDPDNLVAEGGFEGEAISEASEVEVNIDRNSSIDE